MPLTIYTPSNLKKMVKSDLLFHAIDLQDFINLFDDKNTKIKNDELKKENEKLKQQLMARSNNLKGEITCDCQLGNPCEGAKPEQIAPNGELCCSYDGDIQTKIIWDLKQEIQELKTLLIKVPKGSMNYSYMKNLEEETEKLKNTIKKTQELLRAID